MATVIFATRARRALLDALTHIAKDNPVAAFGLIADLQRRVVQTLGTFPEAGVKWHDDRRALTIRRYVFAYRYDAERDKVVAMNVFGPGVDWR